MLLPMPFQYRWDEIAVFRYMRRTVACLAVLSELRWLQGEL